MYNLFRGPRLQPTVPGMRQTPIPTAPRNELGWAARSGISDLCLGDAFVCCLDVAGIRWVPRSRGTRREANKGEPQKSASDAHVGNQVPPRSPGSVSSSSSF